MSELEVNVARNKIPYQFKNLLCNAETVFTGHGNVHLYVSQSCVMCNYNSMGYYTYIKDPQNFKCSKCKYEWSICGSEETDRRLGNIENILFELDEAISRMIKVAL